MCNTCVSVPLSQKEHCHERYTTLISARTYLAEVAGNMELEMKMMTSWEDFLLSVCSSQDGEDLVTNRHHDTTKMMFVTDRTKEFVVGLFQYLLDL